MKNIAALLIPFSLLALSCKVRSGNASTNPSLTVVSFNSICCGVRSDSFLKSFYNDFTSQENIKLKASKVTACGKEGEYKVIFHTADLSGASYRRFSEALKDLVDKEAERNKSNQDGTLNIEMMDSIDVSYCRGSEVAF